MNNNPIVSFFVIRILLGLWSQILEKDKAMQLGDEERDRDRVILERNGPQSPSTRKSCCWCWETFDSTSFACLALYTHMDAVEHFVWYSMYHLMIINCSPIILDHLWNVIFVEESSWMVDLWMVVSGNYPNIILTEGHRFIIVLLDSPIHLMHILFISLSVVILVCQTSSVCARYFERRSLPVSTLIHDPFPPAIASFLSCFPNLEGNEKTCTRQISILFFTSLSETMRFFINPGLCQAAHIPCIVNKKPTFRFH